MSPILLCKSAHIHKCIRWTSFTGLYEGHGQSEYLRHEILCQNVKTFKKNSVLHVFFLDGNGPFPAKVNLHKYCNLHTYTVLQQVESLKHYTMARKSRQSCTTDSDLLVPSPLGYMAFTRNPSLLGPLFHALDHPPTNFPNTYPPSSLPSRKRLAPMF